MWPMLSFCPAEDEHEHDCIRMEINTKATEAGVYCLLFKPMSSRGHWNEKKEEEKNLYQNLPNFCVGM